VKSSLFLEAAIGVDFFLSLQQVMRKFPLLSPIVYLFVPPSILLTLPRVLKINSEEVRRRIERRGQTQHLDYFEQILPADAAPPTDKKQIAHLEIVAGQLLVAAWDPVAGQFYSNILFLLQNPQAYAALVSEIRTVFKSYDEITPDSVANMKYLHACIQETFRFHQSTSDGLPRRSPGAIVDGVFIPKGVSRT
jgi:cytochrome P450